MAKFDKVLEIGAEGPYSDAKREITQPENMPSIKITRSTGVNQNAMKRAFSKVKLWTPCRS